MDFINASNTAGHVSPLRTGGANSEARILPRFGRSIIRLRCAGFSRDLPAPFKTPLAWRSGK